MVERTTALEHFTIIPKNHWEPSSYSCLFLYASVVQLLLTYGPFYKNVTTRGPLPTKWWKTQIHKIYNWKGKKSVRQWNYYTITNSSLLQTSISGMRVVEASLTLLYLVGIFQFGKPIFAD